LESSSRPSWPFGQRGDTALKIRDQVNVLGQPTIVRLEQLKSENPGWISERFFLTEELHQHLSVLEKLLTRQHGCGLFLIGHYGSGKSHLLAFLDQALHRGDLGRRGLNSLPVSLLNFKAEQSLESILESELGLRETVPDRRNNWEKLHQLNPGGLFLLLDELSEFLRSKPTRQSFNEDIRFLQFLGEWAQDHPLWILAALQEQIEHTGEIELDLYRKIKDRYPIRFLLTTAHVKDLISRKILQKAPTYASAVEKLARELKSLFPEMDDATFSEIYPLHPATLDLLEEVRDRFSQARGIIGFTLTRLLGDETRGIPPFLDQPWGHLLSPDAIVDHFSDLFEVQPEFLPIAQRVFPYYRKNIPHLFENRTQQELAWRLLKLLILVHLSPLRKELDSALAAQWLLLKVTTLDPARNREIVQKTLQKMAREGAYLTQRENSFKLNLEDQSREDLDELMARTLQEISGQGDTLFETLIPLLEEADFNPFVLPRDRWQNRKVRWHFHEWDFQVYLGSGTPPPVPGLALQIGIPWGEPPSGSGLFRLIPRRLGRSPEILELAALVELRERPLPALLRKRIEEKLRSRLPWFFTLMQSCYADPLFHDPRENRLSPPLDRVLKSIQQWINSYGEAILRQTYPAFERFAPTAGPLPREAFRQLMENESQLCAAEAPDLVKLIREAYLVPMGLLQRRGNDYVFPAKLDHHELVRLLDPVIEQHPSVSRVYEHLAAPPYGLRPDQIHLLLIQLLLQGDLDLLKGSHSYRDHYPTLPDPISYDKVVPGRSLSLDQLRDLQLLAEGMNLRIPRQLSVLAQKNLIGQLRQAGREERQRLGQFRIRLMDQAGTEELILRLENQLSAWMALEKGENELQAFHHFLYTIQAPARFLALHREFTSLPDRFDKLLRETQRASHLLSYPCMRQLADPQQAVRLESLGAPPSLTEPEAAESWLEQFSGFYQDYQNSYLMSHEQYWATAAQHPLWSYQPPSAAQCRQAGLEAELREIAQLKGKAQSSRCERLSSLEFQPLCRCLFDGSSSPLAPILDSFDRARQELERQLKLFYAQEPVREKIREWVNNRLELNQATLDYLEGKSPYPQIGNLELFEKHLAGIELVKTLDATHWMETLSGPIWDKDGLTREIHKLFSQHGPRLSFQKQAPAHRPALLAWCGEMALRAGRPLPAGFTGAEMEGLAGLLRPEWIASSSLERVEDLALPDSSIERILSWLLNGTLVLPDQPAPSGVVRAAADFLGRKLPASLEEMAEQTFSLYASHHWFIRLANSSWLDYLETLCRHSPSPETPRLAVLLEELHDAQWLVFDGLGLPLMKKIEEKFSEFLPHWKLASRKFGAVSSPTQTHQFYLDLLNHCGGKKLEKINAIDRLLHDCRSSFDDLVKRSLMELEISLKPIVKRLDPSIPLLLFADHGFRLAPDGQSFIHGGASTLERIVPVYHLAPW
jgi:hypothetical protein